MSYFFFLSIFVLFIFTFVVFISFKVFCRCLSQVWSCSRHGRSDRVLGGDVPGGRVPHGGRTEPQRHAQEHAAGPAAGDAGQRGGGDGGRGRERRRGQRRRREGDDGAEDGGEQLLGQRGREHHQVCSLLGFTD